MLPPSYKLAHLLGKAVPWLATEIAMKTKFTGRSRDDFWKVFTSRFYSSLIGKIGMVTSLPDGSRVILRPFSGDTAIVREVYEENCYTKLFHPRRADICIDVGAHIGLFTVKASRLVGPAGLVIAIEPHPENYLLLRKNIGLLKLHNVITLRALIGSTEGYQRLYLADENSGHSIFIERVRDVPSKKIKSIKVPMTTLDRLVATLGLKRVDFIKVDVEGAEYEAIKGGINVLKQNDVRVVIEVDDRRVKAKVKNLLEKLGYSIAEYRMWVYAKKGDVLM